MTKIIDRTGKGASINQAENDANMDSLSGKVVPITTTTYTIDIDDQNDLLEVSNASAVAITLDDISTIAAALHTSDFKVTIKNIGAGLVTITRGGTDTFEGGGTSFTVSQGNIVTIQTDSTLAIWNINNESDYINRALDDTPTGNYTFTGTVDFSGTADFTGQFLIGGVLVATDAAQFNYSDIATLGVVQANKVITSDSNSNTEYGTTFTVVGADTNIMEVSGLTFTAGRVIEVDMLCHMSAGGGGVTPYLVINGDLLVTNYHNSQSIPGSASANNPTIVMNGWNIANVANHVKISIMPDEINNRVMVQVITNGSDGTAISYNVTSIVYTVTDVITSIGIRDSAAASALIAGSKITARMV